MRTHNLRYSSAVNDFSSYPNTNEASTAQQDDDVKNNTVANERGKHNRSELSQETQERQNQAMKLLNEDNPFESN